jgi:hypothetical protein
MTTDRQDADVAVAADVEADIAAGVEADAAADAAEEGEFNEEGVLERTVLYAFDQGAEILEQRGELEPFTILIEGEELYIEEHPAESEEESYASARRTVYQMERLCDAYVLCYDGYVNLEEGTSDALVIEYAHREDAQAQTIIRLYHRHGEDYHFGDELYQVGEAESLFSDAVRAAPSAGQPVGDGVLDVPPAPVPGDAKV